VTTPFLTVAIPTLDRLDYLAEAIASARAQTYEPFEILVSDDGHLGQTRELAVGLQREDARIRYIRTSGHIGLAGNWNHCADEAAGTHLVVIGDDDRLLPNFLSSLGAHTWNADVVFSNHDLIDEKGRVLEDSSARLAVYGRAALASGPVSEPEAIAWRNGVPPSATLVRAELVRQLRFNERLNTPELEFYVRAAAAGARFWFEPRVLSEFRVHSLSETSRGLRYEALLDSLLGLRAVTAAGDRERERQLALVARAALSEALARGRGASARKVAETGYLRSRTLRMLAAAAAFVPAPALRTTVRAFRRLWGH
jgi:glycosyltransferase involved in cell wall biosynthesis